MTNDLMIDNETLSTRKNAVLLTCGAIRFDRYGDIRTLLPHYPTSAAEILSVTQSYYARIDYEEAKRLGFHVDGPGKHPVTGKERPVGKSTVEWWLKQSPEARHEAFAAGPRIGADQFLNELFMFAGGSLPWSHGANFDLAMLEDWYSIRGIECPWRFTSARCTRTIFDLFVVDAMKGRGKAHHHALFDCWDQIIMVQQCFRSMREISLKAAAFDAVRAQAAQVVA